MFDAWRQCLYAKPVIMSDSGKYRMFTGFCAREGQVRGLDAQVASRPWPMMCDRDGVQSGFSAARCLPSYSRCRPTCAPPASSAIKPPVAICGFGSGGVGFGGFAIWRKCREPFAGGADGRPPAGSGAACRGPPCVAEGWLSVPARAGSTGGGVAAGLIGVMWFPFLGSEGAGAAARLRAAAYPARFRRSPASR